VDNTEIARVLEEISQLLATKSDSPFKIRAYRNAAHSIASYPVELTDLVAADADLRDVPGVGDAIAGKIREMVMTGRLEYCDRLKGELPVGILELMSLPGVGPRTAARLSSELGILSLDQLEAAVESGAADGLAGMSDRTVQGILRGLKARRADRTDGDPHDAAADG